VAPPPPPTSPIKIPVLSRIFPLLFFATFFNHFF
jgi:hypothetical protein